MVLFFSFLAFLSTFLGGLFGLKNKGRLNLILGFTAGVLVGVVAFDLFPEIINLVNKLQTEAFFPMAAFVGAFLLFHFLEKIILIHHSHEESYETHKHPYVGILSALALIGHSFLDGVGIGLGFQVSVNIGLVVALAIIAHDFSDGINTVSLLLVSKNSSSRAKQFLFLDSLAPVAGALSANFFRLSENALLLYLGFFAGFLMYIGAADILPEAHRQKSSYTVLLLTLLGVTVIFLVTRLTG